MTNRQGAVLASRIFCVWFLYNSVVNLYNAVVNLAILPNFVGALQQSNAYSSHLQKTMLMNVFADFLRLGVDVAAAIFFYRCDPWLTHFLTGEPDAERTEADVSS